MHTQVESRKGFSWLRRLTSGTGRMVNLYIFNSNFDYCSRYLSWGIIATRGVITTCFGWFSVRTYQQTSSTVSTELRERERERSEENLNQKEMEREKALAAEQAENEKVTEDGVGEATALRRHRFAQTTRTKVRTKVKLKWW